ncbi:alpha 1,2 mannosyltransferase [Mortierella alpina]|nr:alpha 1,2 mannosyltransferase [Mortierella alpina]
MRRYRPFSRATWTIYLLLLAFRIFNALSPGYIHPDEFFQSAEITAGNIFGLDVNIPWEYKPELPCRSILIPAITTGIPYMLLKTWIGTDTDHFVTTRALFITQRLAFVVISLIIGVLFAVGTFTRITFVVYGFPLGVMFLSLNFKAAFTKNRTIVAGASKFLVACLPLALGLTAMSAFAVLIDSIYFHKLIIYNISNGVRLSLRDILITHPKEWHQLSYKGSLTLTVWNNLRYNLDEKNLAEHGLHPRFFHLFLNFPVLFGNLALIAVVTLLRKCRAGEWGSQSKLVTRGTLSHTLDSTANHLTLWTDIKTRAKVLGTSN